MLVTLCHQLAIDASIIRWSSRLGRRIAAILGAYGVLFSMLAVAYSNSVEMFIITRFLMACFGMGETIALFTHSELYFHLRIIIDCTMNNWNISVMEIVDSSWRTRVGIGYQITFAIGFMLWTPIAYLYRDWHQMQVRYFDISKHWHEESVLVYWCFAARSARCVSSVCSHRSASTWVSKMAFHEKKRKTGEEGLRV